MPCQDAQSPHSTGFLPASSSSSAAFRSPPAGTGRRAGRRHRSTKSRILCLRPSRIQGQKGYVADWICHGRFIRVTPRQCIPGVNAGPVSAVTRQWFSRLPPCFSRPRAAAGTSAGSALYRRSRPNDCSSAPTTTSGTRGTSSRATFADASPRRRRLQRVTTG